MDEQMVLDSVLIFACGRHRFFNDLQAILQSKTRSSWMDVGSLLSRMGYTSTSCSNILKITIVFKDYQMSRHQIRSQSLFTVLLKSHSSVVLKIISCWEPFFINFKNIFKPISAKNKETPAPHSDGDFGGGLPNMR